jgi:hypothetical protein
LNCAIIIFSIKGDVKQAYKGMRTLFVIHDVLEKYVVMLYDVDSLKMTGEMTGWDCECFRTGRVRSTEQFVSKSGSKYLLTLTS